MERRRKLYVELPTTLYYIYLYNPIGSRDIGWKDGPLI
jgi:hypothetical protein